MGKWDESQHPRVPGGSKNGGRWTAVGQRFGDYTLSGVGELNEMGMDEYEINNLYGSAFSGFAENLWESAVEMEETALITDMDDNIKAFYSGSTQHLSGRGWPYGSSPYSLSLLGVADDSMGWGAVAFAEACQEAQAMKATGLVLHSGSLLSDRFYDAMGMHRVGGNSNMPLYWLSSSEIDALLEAYNAKRK